MPVELVIATTDPDLYDSDTNTWKWSGQMYWAVECLQHDQRTVADRVVPYITPTNYMPLDHSPSIWNYCKSQRCGAESVSMQIVFTFNPHSTDPNDFLQFVINHCHVTDVPRHDIRDENGHSFYLDIVEVSKLAKDPYIEVWIAKTHLGSVLETNSGVFRNIIPGFESSQRAKQSYVGIVLVTILCLLIIGLIIFSFAMLKLPIER